MIKVGDIKCPNCSGTLRYFNRVKRIIRTKSRRSKWIDIRRLKCVSCGMIHRELPTELMPYKQYETDIILGVLEGLITCETFGFEDYPCEATMKIWLARKSQLLLWR